MLARKHYDNIYIYMYILLLFLVLIDWLCWKIGKLLQFTPTDLIFSELKLEIYFASDHLNWRIELIQPKLIALYRYYFTDQFLFKNGENGFRETS